MRAPGSLKRLRSASEEDQENCGEARLKRGPGAAASGASSTAEVARWLEAHCLMGLAPQQQPFW